MCLAVSYVAKQHIAIEDVPIYKVLVKHILGGFHGPFQRQFRWSKNCMHCSILDKPDRTHFHSSKYVIERGLHAFLNLEDAKNYRARPKEFVAKMVIPKGTPYYIGINNRQVAAARIFWPED